MSPPALRLVRESDAMLGRLCLFLLLFAWPAAVSAAVKIQFYSKDQDKNFPHAFVRLTGTLDSTGQAVDANYGFTARRISPSILLGPVAGQIVSVSPDYVARSQMHFSLLLTDEQVAAVEGVVERWRRMPQPSYRLGSRNCVHFAAEVAGALGLYAPPDPKLMKKPKSFLAKVTRDNQALIAGWRDPTRHAATGARR